MYAHYVHIMQVHNFISKLEMCFFLRDKMNINPSNLRISLLSAF